MEKLCAFTNFVLSDCQKKISWKNIGISGTGKNPISRLTMFFALFFSNFCFYPMKFWILSSLWIMSEDKRIQNDRIRWEKNPKLVEMWSWKMGIASFWQIHCKFLQFVWYCSVWFLFLSCFISTYTDICFRNNVRSTWHLLCVAVQ